MNLIKTKENVGEDVLRSGFFEIPTTLHVVLTHQLVGMLPLVQVESESHQEKNLVVVLKYLLFSPQTLYLGKMNQF